MKYLPLLILLAIPAQARTYGPFSPASTSDDATDGTRSWSNTDNIKVADGVYAEFTTSLMGGSDSTYLEGLDYNPGITSTATITGVQIDYIRKDKNGNGVLQDIGVYRVTQGANIDTTAMCNNTSVWSSTGPETITCGGPGQLFGKTWTPMSVAFFDSGYAFRAKATDSGALGAIGQIDSIKVTYYTDEVDPAPPAHAGVETRGGVYWNGIAAK